MFQISEGWTWGQWPMFNDLHKSYEKSQQHYSIHNTNRIFRFKYLKNIMMVTLSKKFRNTYSIRSVLRKSKHSGFDTLNHFLTSIPQIRELGCNTIKNQNLENNTVNPPFFSNFSSNLDFKFSKHQPNLNSFSINLLFTFLLN